MTDPSEPGEGGPSRTAGRQRDDLLAFFRSWRREEPFLRQGKSALAAVIGGLGLVLPVVLGIDGLVRWRAIQADHQTRLQESVAVLTATLSGVERTALDWGHWTSMYRWIQGTNPTFVTTDVETTPVFDEGGLFLIFNPDGSERLSFGQKGHDHPSYKALFTCARGHLHRLPTILSRIHLICRAGDGQIFLGVATPLSDSLEQAAPLGTLVLFEPMFKPAYGNAFNRPLRWISSHMRRVAAAPAPQLTASALPLATASPGASQGAAKDSSKDSSKVAPAWNGQEQLEPLGLSKPLYTEGDQVIVLGKDAPVPPLLRGLARDSLVAVGVLGSLLAARMVVLVERRRQRLILRRSEQCSNRRIRRAGHDLDRVLSRLGLSPRDGAADDQVLARLIESPASGAELEMPRNASMERKLERLADQFQNFLERAKVLALLDPLTQLPNRRYFIEQLQMQVEGSKRHHHRFAILFVDVDKFKNINDSYGHAIGDAALVMVAKQLRSLTRSDDFLGRYGGDEFAILIDLSAIPEHDPVALKQTLDRYARRIVAPFEQAIELDGFKVELNISVGISLIDSGDPDVEGAMRRSDIAMYRAKQNSQSRIAIFDPDSDATHLDNYQLYVDLMQSIRDRHFQILFQPIVDRQGRLHSLEALSRWHHPRLGVVGPDVFVDLAQRYRQIDQLSDELINLSLQSFRELSEGRSELTLSLNLPPSKLSDPHLVERLCEQIKAHHLSPHLLTIELTERSVLMPNPVVSSNLRKMRDCGMSIALDDFGTGYSSLSLLSTLQPNEVKIDKSFVMAMQRDEYAHQIVTVIADMAPRMNLVVVAEGVEDAAVMDLLGELGIRYFQGFLFSKPLSVAELQQSRFLAPA